MTGDGRFEDPTREALKARVEPAGVTRGTVFVLAGAGLRCLARAGDGFLGHPPEEVFWTDVLGLVHEEDRLHAEFLISEAIENPGASLSAQVRFRDASGGWRPMDFCVQNVLEAPDDPGLVIANVRDAAPRGYEADGATP